MADTPQISDPKQSELNMLIDNRDEGIEWRERRHDEWNENYTLYRDKVQVNRLTQRQSVNLPVMKYMLKTLLKDVDDMVILEFENLDNDELKEKLHNEYWKDVEFKNRMELKDIADKKQVMLFGRSFKQWNIVTGFPSISVVDPMDIAISRYADPTDIDSSRYLHHSHIYQPLSIIENRALYDPDEIKKLKEWYKTDQGLIKSAENMKSQSDKNDRMRMMGVNDVDNPVLGETVVELAYQICYPHDKDELYAYLIAEDRFLLMKAPLAVLIGDTSDDYWKTHYNYTSWADDIDTSDFWTDGVADTIRTPHKVLNSFFSQLVENRTLRNFGMTFYNSSIEANTNFTPNSFEPGAFRFYPIPVPDGQRISDVLMRADIPDLSESMDEIMFVLNILEKASGATATQQGSRTQGQTTLGEVELALTEAKERSQSMSKYYIEDKIQLGYKFAKLVEGAHDKLDPVKIHRKGKDGKKYYSTTVDPSEMRTKQGFDVKVWSQNDKDLKDSKKIQNLMGAIQIMPQNNKLRDNVQRKALEFAGLENEEIEAIMAEEEERMNLMNQMMDSQTVNPNQLTNGAPPQVPTGVMPQVQ